MTRQTPAGALGDMVRDSWRRGRRVGFLEGLTVGFIFGVALLWARFVLQ